MSKPSPILYFRLAIIAFFVLCISLLCIQAEAQEQQPVKKYYDDSKKGWWWYEKIPEKSKEEKKEDKKTAAVPPVEAKPPEIKLPSIKDYTPERLWSMHPDEFEPLLKRFHRKAIMNPNEENMYEYLVIYDIARRKALAVANVQMAMMQKHPEFNTGNEYPVASPGRNAYTRETGKEISKKISEGRQDFALIYFYSDSCGYCKEQSNILGFFTDKHKWEIKKIDINASPQIALRFNVERVPYLMLIYRGSKEHFPVAAGVIAMDDMEDRIFRGMRLLTGEIKMDEYSIYDFQKGGTFDTNKYKSPAPEQR